MLSKMTKMVKPNTIKVVSIIKSLTGMIWMSKNYSYTSILEYRERGGQGLSAKPFIFLT